MTRINEQDLIIPALYIISKQPGITTSELISELRSIFHPTGEDAEILQGRNDDKFSQIVRNLVSHHTLDDRFGYTILTPVSTNNSSHTITEKGSVFLIENITALENLLSNNFAYPTIVKGIKEISASHKQRKKIIVFDENILITEGGKRYITTQIYERSIQLRDRAIAEYSKNGRILCQSCGFDFYETYGEIGKGFTEIHHHKPIFQYDDTEFSRILSDAVKNVSPLCSNCHRILHRNKKKPLTIKELRRIILRQKKKTE